MKTRRYADWVARLEVQSRRQPRWYRAKVVLWVLMGFGLVALMLGVSSLGLAVLAGGALWMLTAGPKSLLALFKLGKLLLLLALPLGRMIWTGTRALLVRLPPPQGQPLLREEAPQLFEALDRMQVKLKGPAFHQVLLIDEMNAAVVQRPLFGWIGFPRNTLLLGLPLLESLSAREALAVVAHEYGHLAAEHSRFGAYIYRLRSSWRQIQDLTFQWEGLTGRFMRGLVGLYAPAFDAYTFVLARAQEYEADRTGARLLGAEAMASALKRLPLAAAHEQQVYGYPDRPRALFREGRARLEAGDERGLDCLERCMALDADATLQACELAWRHLQGGDATRAKAYETRWRERQALLDRIQDQLANPDAGQRLLPHGLDADTIERMEQVLDEVRQHCEAVYLLRRQLPAAPQRVTHVLVVQPSRGIRFKGRADVLVQALRAADWPVELMVLAQGDVPRIWRQHLRNHQASRLH